MVKYGKDLEWARSIAKDINILNKMNTNSYWTTGEV